MSPSGSSIKAMAALVMALVTAPAFAGTLASDPNAFMGWSGSTPFQGLDLNNNPTGLEGYVEWAVYAPDDYPAGFLGYTPTNDAMVYAYQIFATGTAPISSFSVELQNPADNIGTFTGGGVAGDASIAEFLLPVDSANWLFGGILQNGTSVGLAYSSPNLPMTLTGTTINHGSAAAVVPLPSPSSLSFIIPEPASWMLGLGWFAALGFSSWRRYSRPRRPVSSHRHLSGHD